MAQLTNPMSSYAGMTPEEIDIARKQKLAERLQAQADQPLQGQMVGNIYVAPSWTQGLAKLLNSYQAGKVDREADQQTKDYRQKMSDMLRGTMAQGNVTTEGPAGPTMYQVDGVEKPFASRSEAEQYINANDPKQELGSALYGEFGGNNQLPANTDFSQYAGAPYVAPNMAPKMGITEVPGQPAKTTTFDFNRVMQAAMQNPDNPLFGTAMNYMATHQAQPPEWKLGERFNEKTGMPEKFMYDARNPMNMMPVGGTQAAKLEFVNGQGVNPYTAQRQGAAIPKQPDMASDLLIPDGQGGYRLNDQLVQAKKDIAKSGASNVNVNTRQESEESKTVGKGFGEDYITIQKAGQMANGKIARYQRLTQLLDGVNTGKLTPMGTEIASAAQSLGLNIDPNLGNKQAAAALSNEMALSLRNPSGGAGMPGALSDKDREFLTGMVPGIDKTPAGRKLMTDSAIALAKRDVEVSNLARAYRQKHGHIDDGFYSELQQYADSHPLFAGKEMSTKPAATLPGGWSVKEH